MSPRSRRKVVRRPDVGAKFRAAREARNLSRERFAVACGTSSSTIKRLEEQGALPSVALLSELAWALGLNLNDLLAATDDIGAHDAEEDKR